MYQVRRCGDSGVLLELDRSEDVHGLAGAIRSGDLDGVLDVVPALHTVLVRIDPQVISVERLEAQLPSLSTIAGTDHDCEQVTIPVVYDGVDLPFVAEYADLTVDEVIRAHTESTWQAAFCGFAPGYAYLTGGDPRLEMPRRGESRVRVPAGAVALAGPFSAVYPRESPGGWQLIGRTDAQLWDVHQDPPALITPGTQVRFQDVGSHA